MTSADDSDNLPLGECGRSAAAGNLELGFTQQIPAVVFNVGRFGDRRQFKVGRGINPSIKNVGWRMLSVIHQQARHHVLSGAAGAGHVITCKT